MGKDFYNTHLEGSKLF